MNQRIYGALGVEAALDNTIVKIHDKWMGSLSADAEFVDIKSRYFTTRWEPELIALVSQNFGGVYMPGNRPISRMPDFRVAHITQAARFVGSADTLYNFHDEIHATTCLVDGIELATRHLDFATEEEVLIIGAGPVGRAYALVMAAWGLRVTVADLNDDLSRSLATELVNLPVYWTTWSDRHDIDEDYEYAMIVNTLEPENRCTGWLHSEAPNGVRYVTDFFDGNSESPLNRAAEGSDVFYIEPSEYHIAMAAVRHEAWFAFAPSAQMTAEAGRIYAHCAGVSEIEENVEALLFGSSRSV